MMYSNIGLSFRWTLPLRRKELPTHAQKTPLALVTPGLNPQFPTKRSGSGLLLRAYLCTRFNKEAPFVYYSILLYG